jgi:hypothetical protein
MKSEPTSFADLAHQFSLSLDDGQAAAFKHLLAVLKDDTQSQLTVLSRSTSSIYRLLDELTVASS